MENIWNNISFILFYIFFCFLGAGTYLKSLFDLFGCILIDFQLKRSHLDPFQTQNYQNKDFSFSVKPIFWNVFSQKVNFR